MRGRRKWSKIDVSSRWPIAGPKKGFENKVKSEVWRSVCITGSEFTLKILALFERAARNESICVNESRVEVKREK